MSLESAGSALALCSFSPSMPGSSEDWIYSAMPCSLSAVAGLPYRSHTLLHMCSFTLVPHTWLWSAIFLSSFMSSLFLRASFHRTCLFFVVPGILQVQEGLPGSPRLLRAAPQSSGGCESLSPYSITAMLQVYIFCGDDMFPKLVLQRQLLFLSSSS